MSWISVKDASQKTFDSGAEKPALIAALGFDGYTFVLRDITVPMMADGSSTATEYSGELSYEELCLISLFHLFA